jgi:hypothetical protein
MRSYFVVAVAMGGVAGREQARRGGWRMTWKPAGDREDTSSSCKVSMKKGHPFDQTDDREAVPDLGKLGITKRIFHRYY